MLQKAHLYLFKQENKTSIYLISLLVLKSYFCNPLL